MSDRRPTAASSDADHQRLDRVDEVLFAHVQRRYRGEEVSDDDLVRAHPELMPELKDQLELLSQMEPANAAEAATSQRGSLNIRCPYCRQTVSVSSDAAVTDITCSSCGGRFSLDLPETQGHESSRRLGHFELVEQVGAGSFGSVWKARDTELDRIVAVKIPRQERLNTAELEQFVREARAAAQLKHPNIVSVHEVGREQDTVYIVSDFIDGVTVADWLTARQPNFRDAARLCLAIASALQHAHDAGVIHRDLKPQNIMLDTDGQPHLMDFGLARRAAGEITMTIDGRVLGTPAYMSPEQARGEAHRADRRADVYSLGVILFELLTGELPFRGNARMMLHQVLHEEPPSPRKLNSSIPKDLETICLKCLEKEPEKRYASAENVVQELRRVLSGKPVVARPISPVGRGWRWCKRNRLPTALATGLAIALTSGLVASFVMWRKAENAAQENYELNYFASMNLAGRAWDDGNIDQVLGTLRQYRIPKYRHDIRGFEYFLLTGLCARGYKTFGIVNGVPCEDVAISPNGEFVAFTSRSSVRVWEQMDSGVGFQPKYEREHSGNVVALAISPVGKTLATGDVNGTLSFYDLSTGEISRQIHNKEAITIRGLTFNATGDFLAGIVGGKILIFNHLSDTPETVRGSGQRTDAVCLAVSSDNQMLATGHEDNKVRLWSTPDGKLIRELSGHVGRVTAVAFHPNKNLLATGSDDKSVRIWLMGEHRPAHVLEKHVGRITELEFLPDGKTLWTGSADNTIRQWDTDTWTERHRDVLKGHSSWILSLSATSDGETLVSGSWDGTLKVWNVEENTAMRVVASHAATVNSISISRDGRFLVSGGDDGTVQLRYLKQGKQAEVLRDFGEDIDIVAISPDGTKVAAIGGNGTLFIEEIASKETVFENRVASAGDWWVHDVEFIQNDRVAIGTTDGFQIWDVNAGQRLLKSLTPAAWRLAVSPDKSRLAFSSHAFDDYEFSVNIYNVESKEQTQQLLGFLGMISDIEFSPDGRTVAAGGMGEELRIYHSETGELIHDLDVTQAHVQSLAFSPDGKILAAAESEYSATGVGRVSLWDVSTGKRRFSFRVDGTPRSIAFAPNGTMLAVAAGNEVVLYETASRKEAVKLLAPDQG